MRYVTRTITEYAVICARCGARGPWALSREEARDAADADGWVLGTGLCPECYDEPEEYLARALKALDKNPLLREAYKYAISFPGDREVRDPMEIDGLPRYVLYYHYLARKGEADYRFYDGTVAFVVREP
ncbi:MAG: hypothetical protein NZ821_07340 [Gloeomargarita sp. SKYB31]|nr:hypothetical protein [Gloeomargarita sp. SKYB31]